ncbi:MAG TPA: tetratricopeptide repeat protein [Pyrinomonadaceae bacterium]|nr:tetratricopeptide repeat protein [Pyrinomonadaceae bacterium]
MRLKIRKTLFYGVGLTICLALTLIKSAAQEDVDARYKLADTNNAVIEGRIAWPSGFSAEQSIRITLRNTQMILSTRYSNKHGEFRFDNLPEGVYYVQAEVPGDEFDEAVTKIALGRGITAQVRLQLLEKKLPIGFTAARVVSVAELRQSVPTAAKKQYALGLRSVAKGDVATAAKYFEQAISIYPEYLAARNDLGVQYLKLKRVDEAEKYFRMVLEDDPKNFNAQYNLGLVRIERKDYAAAIAELNKSIVIDSTRPVARLWLGYAFLETGDLATAERELTKALIMGGAQCVAAHYHLARIYLARGDKKEALRAVRAYLDDAPKGEYATEAKQLEKQIQSLP